MESTAEIMARIDCSSEYLKKYFDDIDTVVVLGSGLGEMTQKLDDKVEVQYSDIPFFPKTTVFGHAGKLVIGNLGDKKIAFMNGRFHYYEGYTFKELAYPVRVFKQLNIRRMILTNASGGINKEFKPGDLMIITDHIKFFDESPLRGQNMGSFGPRFNDMSTVYDEGLIEKAKAVAPWLKEGVYAFMPGPSFETPAEIRALRVVGADAVGMSTVPEVISCAHCGIKVLGISCITNMAAGILKTPLSHEEVLETGKQVNDKFWKLIVDIIK